MKHECGGIPITEFVGLQAKLYGFKTLDEEIKKAKGVKKSAIEKEICFAD